MHSIGASINWYLILICNVTFLICATSSVACMHVMLYGLDSVAQLHAYFIIFCLPQCLYMYITKSINHTEEFVLQICIFFSLLSRDQSLDSDGADTSCTGMRLGSAG